MAPMQAAMAQILNSFTYHPPFGDQADRYGQIREEARRFAETLISLCPESPERTEAIRRLEEAVMWANKSIACNERRPTKEASSAPPDVDTAYAQIRPPREESSPAAPFDDTVAKLTED